MNRSLRQAFVAGAAAALLIAGGAAAQGIHDPIQTGNDLYDACSASAAATTDQDLTRDERTARQRCRNYLAGFVQASVVTRTDTGMTSPFSPSGEELFCYELPDQMSWDEMEQLVVTYGEANPDALNMYASDYLVEVFVANYPCPDTATPDTEPDMDGDGE